MKDIKAYAESQAAEAEKLLKELAVIPAPALKEARKAAFCKNWLESHGALDVYVDEAGNVVYPYQVQHRDRLIVVMAHADIPFEEEDRLVVTQKGRILEGPGAGDTGNLVTLLLSAAYFAGRCPDLGQGILFVISTGACGRGNLYGARQVIRDYGARIGLMITLQGYQGQIVERFPGLIRYEISLKHHWESEYDDRYYGVGQTGGRQGDPAYYLSQLLGSLYGIISPESGWSRHGMHTMSCGNSPDTLCEHAGGVFEIAALFAEDLAFLKDQVEEILSAFQPAGIEVDYKIMTQRPCSLPEGSGDQTDLVEVVMEAVRLVTGQPVRPVMADTEASLARELGIPGVTLGTVSGYRPESVWESVELDSQRAGIRLLLECIRRVTCRQGEWAGQLGLDWDPDGEVWRMKGSFGGKVWYRDGLVTEGDCLLKVLDRKRAFLRLPSYIRQIDPMAFSGMEHLHLQILNPEQVMDLKPVLEAKQIWLELGCLEEERILLPLTKIGGYQGIFDGTDQGISPGEAIDYELYDSRFPRIQDKNLQLEMAIARLLYPVGLSESSRNQYENHLKKRFRPGMLRLLSGDWHHWGKAPAAMTRLLKLKEPDSFLRKELVEAAARGGLLVGESGGFAGPGTARASCQIICNLRPGLITLCSLLEDAGRLPAALNACAHVLFHYAYGHPWWRQEDPMWNLACDLSVSYLSDQLLGPESGLRKEIAENCGSEDRMDESGQDRAGGSCRSREFLERQAVYDWLKLMDPVMTAEHICQTLNRFSWTDGSLDRLKALVAMDDHRNWPVYTDPVFLSGEPELKDPLAGELRFKAEVEQALQLVMGEGTGMKTYQGGHAGKPGTRAGSLEKEAGLRKREGQDYKSFLKQFMVCKEDRILDLDSFDPVYYTYGLTKYDDMPFVEPLETKEVNRLEELVIVIDTSGSCQGELVRFFLEETWSVFGRAENFFDRFHVRIIQCDCVVQEDVKLTCLEEVEAYMKQLVIRGGGGTDFRPAFQYVRHLRRQGELRNLKGILYFTDGQGVYPEQIPDCVTAFIFLEGRYEILKIPHWARTLVLPLPKDGSLKLEYSGEFRI